MDILELIKIAEEILPDKICEFFVTKIEKIQSILMSND